MIVKGIIDEDFINYKKPAMVIEFPHCSFKCDKECGRAVCQNSPLINEPNIEISYNNICARYVFNPITQALIFQGLEPADSPSDVYNLIFTLRKRFNCNDDIIIYTGYNRDEIISLISKIRPFKNIIIKYGRYIPDQEPHYDEVLGVNLASDNQYAERL